MTAAALSKGQNGPLSATEVLISVHLAAPGDLSALLVQENGNVRSDADFVFFNQPAGPGVRLQPGDHGQPPSLAVALDAVPPDIAKVRAVVTLEDPRSTFGSAAAPIARVTNTAHDVLYEYRIDGLSSESIVIALEIYRRGSSWKVRAVGQGYAGGFAALVTDHGVSVDDTSADSPSTPPTLPPARTATPPLPPRPATPPPPPPPHSDEISLTKGKPVNLTKGQRVSLKKEGGVALTFVRMGLGWDPVKSKGMFGSRTPDIDLDASAILFADHHLVDICYYGQLGSKDGSIRHQGDNLTGEGEGDDEVIDVDLTRIPPHVTTVIFIVTSYKGHTFDQLSNAFCRLVDSTTSAELARFTLQGTGLRYTAMVMAKIMRTGAEWKLQAIGEGFQAKHPGEAAPHLPRFV